MRQQREEIFKDLYRRYYKRIVRLFMRLHFGEPDAEDLTQDTFMRFYDALDEYRGDAKWAFLETIARHVAINRYRSNAAQKRAAQTVPIDEAVTERQGVTPDPVREIEERRRRDRLYEEIAKLPPRQRRCLLRRMRGESYEHIAKMENTTVDAVKSAIRDAKKTLRAKLGADVLLEEDQ